MSTKLTRSVYQSVRMTSDNKPEIISQEGPFGFYGQQRRPFAVFKQQPWFNRQGEFLGFGDLDMQDIKTIAKKIEEGEWFLVCGSFPKDQLRIAIRSPEQRERLDFIGKFCEVVIYNHHVLIVEHSALKTIPYQGFFRRHNIQWSCLRRADVYHWLMIENDMNSVGEEEYLEIEEPKDQ